jgi:hypothetical protein
MKISVGAGDTLTSGFMMLFGSKAGLLFERLLFGAGEQVITPS